MICQECTELTDRVRTEVQVLTQLLSCNVSSCSEDLLCEKCVTLIEVNTLLLKPQVLKNFNYQLHRLRHSIHVNQS